MSKRDDDVPRRLRWAAVLAAALVLGTGAAAAHASWSSTAALTAGPLASGSLDVSTQWGTDWSGWVPLYPGRSADSALLQVTETRAAGTTLRWRLTATPRVPADLSPYVTAQVFVGACGSGILLPANGVYAPAGGLDPGATVTLCLRVTLSTNTPNERQGTAIDPLLVITADQVTS